MPVQISCGQSRVPAGKAESLLAVILSSRKLIVLVPEFIWVVAGGVGALLLLCRHLRATPSAARGSRSQESWPTSCPISAINRHRRFSRIDSGCCIFRRVHPPFWRAARVLRTPLYSFQSCTAGCLVTVEMLGPSAWHPHTLLPLSAATQSLVPFCALRA